MRREAGPEPEPQPQKKRRVWEDPDDPTLVVPVAGQARVRKLRQTEEETQLTGAPASLAPNYCEIRLHTCGDMPNCLAFKGGARGDA